LSRIGGGGARRRFRRLTPINGPFMELSHDEVLRSRVAGALPLAKDIPIPVAQDPEDVNYVCLLLSDLNALERCPQYGICQCAVCAVHRAEKMSRERAPRRTAAPGRPHATFVAD
jgi:hypothetical protein